MSSSMCDQTLTATDFCLTSSTFSRHVTEPIHDPLCRHSLSIRYTSNTTISHKLRRSAPTRLSRIWPGDRSMDMFALRSRKPCSGVYIFAQHHICNNAQHVRPLALVHTVQHKNLEVRTQSDRVGTGSSKHDELTHSRILRNWVEVGG